MWSTLKHFKKLLAPSSSRSGYILLWKHWVDTWTGCVSRHPTVRVLRCRRVVLAVRLPIGWVLSGPVPSSSGLVSTCFKINMEQDFELVSQVKSWYDMEWYGARKQVDPRSTSDAHALDILENTTVHNGKGYDVRMLWAEGNFELPNNYFSRLVQLKSLEKRIMKDQPLREKYSNTIKEDLDKGYVVKVKDGIYPIRWKVARTKSGTYHSILLLTRTSRARFVGYLTEQLNSMAHLLISHYSPDLTYYKN